MQQFIDLANRWAERAAALDAEGKPDAAAELRACVKDLIPLAADDDMSALEPESGGSGPSPCSRFRDETLERHPKGSEFHDTIRKLAQRWVKTGEWRFRQNLASAAGALLDDASAVHEPKEERDPWITSECAVDLAEACREYLKTFDSYANNVIRDSDAPLSDFYSDIREHFRKTGETAIVDSYGHAIDVIPSRTLDDNDL